MLKQSHFSLESLKYLLRSESNFSFLSWSHPIHNLLFVLVFDPLWEKSSTFILKNPVIWKPFYSVPGSFLPHFYLSDNNDAASRYDKKLIWVLSTIVPDCANFNYLKQEIVTDSVFDILQIGQRKVVKSKCASNLTNKRLVLMNWANASGEAIKVS